MRSILEDAKARFESDGGAGGGEADGEEAPLARLRALLEARGRAPRSLVGWEGWEAIDAAEVATGAAAGKVREKLVRVDEMVATAAGEQA